MTAILGTVLLAGLDSDGNTVILHVEPDGSLIYTAEDSGSEVEATPADLVLLDQTVLGVAAASISFSNISQVYEDLQIKLMGRITASALFTDVNMIFNGSSAANYDRQGQYSTGNSGASTFENLASTSIIMGLSAANAPADAASQAIIDVFAYARTVFQKCVSIRLGIKAGTTSFDNYDETISAWWRSTAAITSVTLTPASGNFVAGTVATLYGIGRVA